MEKFNNYFIVGAIAIIAIVIVIYFLLKYDRIIRINDFKKLVAENNVCNEAISFLLLDRMSFEEMDLLSNEIKIFLRNNFICNLAAYKEGLQLINVQIAEPGKREKIITLLNKLVYQETRIPFLTATGYTMAKQFMAEEVKIELNFLQTKGIKKDCYVN